MRTHQVYSQNKKIAQKTAKWLAQFYFEIKNSTENNSEDVLKEIGDHHDEILTACEHVKKFYNPEDKKVFYHALLLARIIANEKAINHEDWYNIGLYFKAITEQFENSCPTECMELQTSLKQDYEFSLTNSY